MFGTVSDILNGHSQTFSVIEISRPTRPNDSNLQYRARLARELPR